MEEAVMCAEMEQSFNVTLETHQENIMTNNDQQQQNSLTNELRLPLGDSDHEDFKKEKYNSFNANSSVISSAIKENHDQQLHHPRRSHNGIVAIEHKNQSGHREQTLEPPHSKKKRENNIKTSHVNVLEMSDSNIVINTNMDTERNFSRTPSTETNRIAESKPNRQNVLARKRSGNTSHTKQTGALGTTNEPIELDGDPSTHSPVGK